MNKTLRYQSNLMYLVVCIVLILGSVAMTMLGANENIMEATYQYLFMLIPVVVYILLSNQSIKTVLRLKKTSVKSMLLALLIAVVAQPFISLVAIAMQQLFPSYGMMYMPEEGGSLLYSLFLIALTPAICEEIFMRGVVLHGHRGLPVWKVAILNGVLFGLFHNNFDQMFYAAAFGAILAFVVLYTDSIYPAVLMHFVMNGLSVLGDFYPENIYMRATYFYESNFVLLLIFGIASLAATILLIRVLKKNAPDTCNQLVQSEEQSNALDDDVVYPEWPLIFAAAIAVIFSVMG